MDRNLWIGAMSSGPVDMSDWTHTKPFYDETHDTETAARISQGYRLRTTARRGRVVYVAGPFRAQLRPGDQYEQELNIRRAEALALEVWRLGFACICPHANTRFFQGALADDAWLEGDLAILRRCDAILLTADWASSFGARAERAFAEKHGIPVFHDLRELDAWE